jgi:3-deoxy-manno-octulosonate cytidylyltransferase (CMP-KDO synthetase)
VAEKMNDESFSVVIPARYGASRLPGKPLIEIAGRPLIAWVWERAQASAADEVLVATDDERIVAACEEIGAQALMTRSDHASGSERIAEVATARGWPEDRIVVNLQGDEPGISPALLDQVAEGLSAHTDAGVATLACRIDDVESLFDPHLVKLVTDQDGYALYFSRAPIPWHRDEFLHDRSSLPAKATFLRHIGLYAYRVGFLANYVSWPPAPLERAESLEQLRVLWHGGRIHVSIAAERPGPGVDTLEDVRQVARWLAQHPASAPG